MQKAKWIVLLAIVCILAMSLPAAAQLAQGNWPKFGRDYYNSSHSPATVIAKPVVKWSGQCKPWGGASSQWYTSTYDGLRIDPSGNVYAYADYCFGMAKFNSAGTLLANDTGVTDHNLLLFYNGPALYDDGTNQLIIAGPQQCGSGTTGAYKDTGVNDSYGRDIYTYQEAYDYRRAEILDWNLAWVRQTPLFNMANVGSYVPDPGLLLPDTALPGWTTHQSPAIGPDGTCYVGNFQISYIDPIGPLVAINPLDGSFKWSFTDWGLGRSMGSPAIKTVEDGGVTKNVIYTAGGAYYEYSLTFGAPSIYAIRDDGTSATLLWKKSIKAVDNDPVLGTSTGFFTSNPVISADGSTVYAAGRDNMTLRRVNAAVGRAVTGTLFAYDADTGALKWKVTTGGTHACSPALGANGMIYTSGGHFRTGAKLDVPPLATPGKVVAIKDNGTSGEVKWTLELPDDVDSDTTTVATTSTTPTTMYVASGNGRVYCIQDQGTYGKLLWTWQAYDLRYSDSTSRGFAPTNIVIADDGTAYIGMKNFVYAFDATSGGFSPSSPEGISGTVKDADGNPIAGAWVSASTTLANPLADNTSRIWTKTSADGTYQISPKIAGTYNVAAGAIGYEGSAAESADMTSATNKVTKNFVLGPAKYNWAFAATATCSNANASYPATNAVDGNLSTRFQSTAAATTLSLDLGADKSVSEAVIYWMGWYGGVSYSLQYSTDGSTWNAAYTTTAGNGGFPIDWYAGDPTISGPPYSDSATVRPGCAKRSANIIKFSTISARYWKLAVSSTLPTTLGTYTDYSSSRGAASVWEIELRDPTKAGPPASTIGAAKAGEEGDSVGITSAIVTATVDGGGTPTDNIFVESADRTAGIRVHKTSMPTTITFGDKVSVAGHIYTDANGEKYIEATSLARVTTTSGPDGPAIEEVGMNNKAAGDSVSQGMFIKTWGKVSGSTTGSFLLSDGSAAPIKVLCDSSSSISLPADDDYIRVRGVAGKDADGTALYMRNERADWAYDSDDMHALPFTGAYKYPIQYLVLGPFTTDPAPTNAYDLLDEDFIGEANVGTTILPVEGLVTAGKTWTVGTSASGILDINSVLGGTNESMAAYVFLYVWSETEAPYVDILTGSDDWLNIYVNGTLVNSIDESVYPTGRSCTIGSDITSITLHQGLNSILLKVVNNTSTFKLSSQFIDSGAYGATGYGGYSPYVTTGLGYSLNPAQ